MKKKSGLQTRRAAVRSADRRKSRSSVAKATETETHSPELLVDLRALIQSARQRIASAACASQTLLSWQLGQRLLRETLHGSRAAYGKRILVTVSRELTDEYGRGFSYAELARMVELLELDARSIRVAEYLTELPPVGVLRQRLHRAIEHARGRANSSMPEDGSPS